MLSGSSLLQPVAEASSIKFKPSVSQVLVPGKCQSQPPQLLCNIEPNHNVASGNRLLGSCVGRDYL